MFVLVFIFLLRLQVDPTSDSGYQMIERLLVVLFAPLVIQDVSLFLFCIKDTVWWRWSSRNIHSKNEFLQIQDKNNVQLRWTLASHEGVSPQGVSQILGFFITVGCSSSPCSLPLPPHTSVCRCYIFTDSPQIFLLVGYGLGNFEKS